MWAVAGMSAPVAVEPVDEVDEEACEMDWDEVVEESEGVDAATIAAAEVDEEEEEVVMTTPGELLLAVLRVLVVREEEEEVVEAGTTTADIVDDELEYVVDEAGYVVVKELLVEKATGAADVFGVGVALVVACAIDVVEAGATVLGALVAA